MRLFRILAQNEDLKKRKKRKKTKKRQGLFFKKSVFLLFFPLSLFPVKAMKALKPLVWLHRSHFPSLKNHNFSIDFPIKFSCFSGTPPESSKKNLLVKCLSIINLVCFFPAFGGFWLPPWLPFPLLFSPFYYPFSAIDFNCFLSCFFMVFGSVDPPKSLKNDSFYKQKRQIAFLVFWELLDLKKTLLDLLLGAFC